LYTESLGEDIAKLFGTIHNTLDSTGNGITEITEEKSGKNVRNSYLDLLKEYLDMNEQ
jgi:hypothetical protein